MNTKMLNILTLVLRRTLRTYIIHPSWSAFIYSRNICFSNRNRLLITFGTFCGSRRLVLRVVRLFRSFRFGCFGGFVSVFRDLVHANFPWSDSLSYLRTQGVSGRSVFAKQKIFLSAVFSNKFFRLKRTLLKNSNLEGICSIAVKLRQ